LHDTNDNKIKFAVELSQEIGKLPWLTNLQTKLKPEESSIILYCILQS